MRKPARKRFVEAYEADQQYAAIMAEIRKSPSRHVRSRGVVARDYTGQRLKNGYPFIITDGLLYNVRPDGTSIPAGMVQMVLEAAYDARG